VGQVLRGENTAPRIAAKFYTAVVQAILLYGTKMWNLTNLALARLEGFHICAAYKMARKHQPKRGANGVWVYPKMADVLEECAMATIATYIQSRHQTIAVYMGQDQSRPVWRANGGKGRCCISGGGSNQCAWTLSMQLDPMQMMANWMHPPPRMLKGGGLLGHGRLLQS
jgi:hypothetical protein